MLLTLLIINELLVANSLNSPLNVLDSSVYNEEPSKNIQNMFLGQPLPKKHFIILTNKDKHLTKNLLQDALENSPSFIRHTWENLDNHHKGIIEVLPITHSGLKKCRGFTVIIHAQSEKITISGTACRNGHSEKKWDILGEN